MGSDEGAVTSAVPSFCRSESLWECARCHHSCSGLLLQALLVGLSALPATCRCAAGGAGEGFSGCHAPGIHTQGV